METTVIIEPENSASNPCGQVIRYREGKLSSAHDFDRPLHPREYATARQIAEGYARMYGGIVIDRRQN